jgi:hypothetical protein
VAKLYTLVHWIPSGLNQLYDSILTKLVEENEEDEDYRPVHQILMWVVLAARPLTLAELRQALATSPETGSLDEDDLIMKIPEVEKLCGAPSLEIDWPAIRISGRHGVHCDLSTNLRRNIFLTPRSS